MTRTAFLLAACMVHLLAQQNIATINLREAIVSCRDGIQAAERIRSDWAAAEISLEQRETAIRTARNALDRESMRRRGIWPFRHPMSKKEKARRTREIDVRAADLAREKERDRQAVENEQRRVLGQIGRRMNALVQAYAKDHGYSAIIDNSDGRAVPPAAPNVTREIVELYNRTNQLLP